jgi:hypothetical protein
MNYMDLLKGNRMIKIKWITDCACYFLPTLLTLSLIFRYECELQVILQLKSWITIQHCFLTRHLWGKLKDIPVFSKTLRGASAQLSSSMNVSTYRDPALPNMSWNHLFTQQTVSLLQIYRDSCQDVVECWTN